MWGKKEEIEKGSDDVTKTRSVKLCDWLAYPKEKMKKVHLPEISLLLYIYQILIHPHLNYGLAAWGQASKTSLNKILILQKKVLRMMYFTDIREHAIPLFIDADILPVFLFNVIKIKL